MRVLGCDASTVAIGFCLLEVESDTVISHGVFEPEGPDFNAKLSSAYYGLWALFESLKPVDVFVIEMPVLATWKYRKGGVMRTKSNPATTIKLSQMVGVLRLAAWSYLDKIVTVLPQDRLSALGLPRNLKRDPAKEQVMARVNARYGLDITCDDESDAIAVSLAGVRELRKQKRKETKCLQL